MSHLNGNVVKQSQKAFGIAADVLNRDDQQRLVREFHAPLGPIDVLVLNVGSNVFLPFRLTDIDGW
jgi:NAD(P)-dependent dehydrogenase (short-subunit alcohol dehydrogenase family)